MNHFRIIFLGFLATFTSSWLGLVALPALHYGEAKAALPAAAQPSELVRRGEQVYAGNGCIYCHTQQVRSPEFGSDAARNWGTRRTVAEDYLGDQRAMLGTMRTGPDLSNIGQRMPSTAWHYQHLHLPTSTSPGSIMPPYGFLFESKPVVNGQPDADAIPLGGHGERVGPDGMQCVPTADGRALVAYLLSLKRTQTRRPDVAGN